MALKKFFINSVVMAIGLLLVKLLLEPLTSYLLFDNNNFDELVKQAAIDMMGFQVIVIHVFVSIGLGIIITIIQERRRRRKEQRRIL